MTDLRIDPSAAIAELAKRGHDKVRALLPELPTGLRRRLHNLRGERPMVRKNMAGRASRAPVGGKTVDDFRNAD
jgi:hypothetical protein